MGANRLRRLLGRKPPSPPHGSLVLRQFISTLGPKAAPLTRTLHTPSIVSQADFEYLLRQGSTERELDQLRREINGRLMRHGAKMQGGGWTRLLLGEDYLEGRARRQSHVLRFVISYCVCLKCRVEAGRGDLGMDDLDQMLEDAQLGEEGVEGNVGGNVGVAFVELPHQGLELLGEVLQNQELELGVVKSISAKGGRVVLNSFARMLFGGWEYCAVGLGQVVQGALEKARQYYKEHKGKTERRVYVRGKVYRFGLEGVCGAVYPGGRAGVGVIFRKQVMTVFVGTVALEDSFGAFIDVDVPLYVGFGGDCVGAQTIYEDGTMGEGRYLGVNELLAHVEFGGGDVQLSMR